MSNDLARGLRVAFVIVCSVLLSGSAFQVAGAANVVVFGADPPGLGFNDPTPVAPVGGNPGTTLGEQRLNVFQAAADIWGAELHSNVDIFVIAFFDPLPCGPTSGVLGSAGATTIFASFPNAEFPLTWYHSALADKIADFDLDPTIFDIVASFNVDLGTPGCLETSGWYLGLDTNHGNLINLLTVVLHEFAHGLGFSNFVDRTTGDLFFGLPDIYSKFTLDLTQNTTWDLMTSEQRLASRVNTNNLVWNGPAVTAAVPSVLSQGVPELKVSSPAAVAGSYRVGTAAFGPPLTTSGVTGELALALDGALPRTDACEPILNGAFLAGRIALIDRGNCSFTTKVANAEAAGAIGVVIADNQPGSPPPGLGAAPPIPVITIPAVRVSQEDGNLLKNAALSRSRSRTGVNATLSVNNAAFAGAGPDGRALLYAPAPFQGGSSVSHWDTIATPNLLMEPSINSDLTLSVKSPDDLTLQQLQDVGWAP